MGPNTDRLRDAGMIPTDLSDQDETAIETLSDDEVSQLINIVEKLRDAGGGDTPRFVLGRSKV